MENKLEIFKNEEFGELTILEENGKQYIEATGVAKALGYSNPQKAIRDHCKEEGITIRSVGVQTGYKKDGTTAMQNVDKKFINEGNLYRLITHSKLPSAEKFESWVFDEILPSIRKHGMFATNELLDNPDFAIKVLEQLKQEREEKRLLKTQIEEQKPKVIFAESVSASSTSILVGELAKLIKQNGHEIGQNRLFQWLRDNNFLISRKGTDYNMPTQRSMEMGLFEIKETSITHGDGHISVNKTPKVTGKGQVYFINKFKMQEA